MTGKDPLGILTVPTNGQQVKEEPTTGGDPLGILKKKESTSPAGSASQPPVEQPSKPSEPPTKSAQDTPEYRFDQHIQKTLIDNQRAFDTDIKTKFDELQGKVNTSSLSQDDANNQFQTFIKEREQFYNDKLNRWVDLYSKQYQEEDFQRNKETNPIKSLAKNAWATARYDLPSQFYSARGLVSSSMKKMEEELFSNFKPIATEQASKIDTFYEKAMKTIFGATDEQLQNTQINPEDVKNAPTKIVLDDVRKSIALSKLSQEQKKYLVDNLDKVKDGDFVDWMNYAGSAIGQGIGQIPTSVLTKGSSSIVQQMGSIYLDTINKIAEDEGITPEEVIKQGKDDVIFPLVFGIGTGMLDAIGAKGVAGSVSQKMVMDSFRSRAISILKAGAVESLTETVQTGLEQIGVNKGRGQSWYTTLKNFDWKPLKDAALQGGIAGLFLAGAGKSTGLIFDKARSLKISTPKTVDELITSKAKEVDINNIESINKASEEIQSKIDQNAEIIRENQGPVPSEGTVGEKGQGDSGQNVQQDQVGTSGETNGEAVQQAQGETQVQGQENVKPRYRVRGEVANEPATAPVEQPTEQVVPGPQQTKLGARMEASQEPTAIKESVKGRDQYVPRGVITTNEEAGKILDQWNDTEYAERAIRDTSNEMQGGTRGALAANLYQRYKQQAESSTDAAEKENLYNKAADIAVWTAQNLTKQGQETSIAGKIWKSITSNEDLTVIALEKSVQKSQQKALQPIQQDVQTSKSQFNQEIERIIRERVTTGVEAQLKRAKLITTEQKQRISDALDKLKIQTPKGTAMATTLLPEVWNGSIEAVKRAVLAGADLANAIQTGIDYIRKNHKGDFDEQDFRNKIEPIITPLVGKENINPADVNPDSIKTPKVKGSRKKNLINSLVEEYNKSGSISDKKFDELYAKQLGVKELSSGDRQKIRDLAKVINETEKFKEEVKKDFTKANREKYEQLVRRAQDANSDLQRYAQANPSTVWDTLSTIMQGNLLAPISIGRNIYSNAVYQPLRFSSTAFGSFIDLALTEIAKTNLLGKSFGDIVGKERTISLTGLNKGYFKGGWNGAMEGLYQMKTGARVDESKLREINPQFDPTKAWKRWAEKDRTVSQKVNDAIEGTLGVPAEAMFRLLNLGDKPFRRASELARGFELAELKGLKGDEAMKFVMFADENTAQEMDKAGKQATFQDESQAAKIIQNGIFTIMRNLPGPLKVIAKSQFPFVKTPVNILAETMDYALPVITALRGVQNISKGNKRTGSIQIGKAMTGLMIYQVAKWLLQAGLMTWNDDDEGKRAERRSLQYDTEPPNSINVEAIARGLAGQGFKTKDEDVWIDYKSIGVLGMLLQIRANAHHQREKEGIPEGNLGQQLFVDVGMDGIKTVASAFDQSFLQGTNTLIEALQDPEGRAGQKWLLNTTEALSSIVIPRTITSISQASDEVIRDTRDKDNWTAMQNVFKKNLFQGDKLAARVNLWGEKITGSPEGRDRMLYYLFDVTKFKEVDTDSFKYKLYQKWKENKFNDEWLPAMPKRTISVKGVQVPLTNEEYEQLATEVGTSRAYKVGAYFSGRKQERVKLEDIQKRYTDGYNHGRRKFLMNISWNMWSKKKLQALADSRKK